MDVSVVIGGAVALECDVRMGNPTPKIEWRGYLNESKMLEGGRYLYIPRLLSDHLTREYYCIATNLLLKSWTRRAHIEYQLVENLAPNRLIEYKPVRDLVGIVGKELNFSYIIGIHGQNGTNVALSCTSSDSLNITTMDLVSVIAMLPGNDPVFDVQCIAHTQSEELDRIIRNFTITISGKLTYCVYTCK